MLTLGKSPMDNLVVPVLLFPCLPRSPSHTDEYESGGYRNCRYNMEAWHQTPSGPENNQKIQVSVTRHTKITFLHCALDLWPMALKSQSTWGTITTNVCSKFENNSSSGFWIIVFTSFYEGRQTAGSGLLQHETIIYRDCSDMGDTRISQEHFLRN